MDDVRRWRQRKLDRLKERTARFDGADKTKLDIAMHRLRRQIRLDSRFDEEGVWRTTDTGNHIHINGQGEIDKGNPNVVAALNKKRREGTHKSVDMPKTHSKMTVHGMSDEEVEKTLSVASNATKKHYDKATEVANDPKNRSLVTYTSHGEDHIAQVIEKTNQAADAIDQMSGENGLYSEPVDRKMMLVAAQFHDTGMDGGDQNYPDGDTIRGNHALNSSLHLLENRDEIEAMGVNPDQAALLIFAHTKSKSGINDLGNPDDWTEGLDRVEKAVNEYNERNPDHPIKFDRDNVFGGEPTTENIKQMAASTAALRLGDANREANIPLRAQGGGEYKIEQMPPRGTKSAGEEIAGSKITIKTEDGVVHELSADDDLISQVPGWEYSKQVVLGERNMSRADTKYDKDSDSLVEHITLGSGHDVPWSTSEALLERCGELATINGTPRKLKVTLTGINNNGEVPDNVRDAYKQMCKEVRTKVDKKTGKLKYEGIDEVIFEFDDGSVSSVKIKDENSTFDSKGWQRVW